MTSAPATRTLEWPIYPRYCDALSPTLGKWCPLRVSDVFGLREINGFAGQDIFHHLNHPIKYVKLTGVIVAIDEFPFRVLYTLDDGSGVNIECSCVAPPKVEPITVDAINGSTTVSAISKVEYTANALNAMKSPDGPNLAGIDVGSVVKVKGGIGSFRGLRKIKMKRIVLLKDTNAEALAWKEMASFRREILEKPWVVSRTEEESCRVEAEKEKWREEEKKAKEKRIARRGHREGDVEKKRSAAREKTSERARLRELEKEQQSMKRPKKRGAEGLDPENKVNYPSKAVRMRVAGKYDALGL